MRLTMKERKAVTGVTAARYRQARKKEKEKQMLDEFCRTTGRLHLNLFRMTHTSENISVFHLLFFAALCD
jgi:hypothetical protein